MALSSVDFHLNFSLNSSTKKFVITDITDYASQSVAEAAANGVIKIIAPSGVVYNNTNFLSPDVDVDVSRINSTTIPIPLLTGTTTPEPGVYTVVYTVNDGVNTVSSTKTFTYSYSSPTVKLGTTVDCLSPLLTSTDSTDYTVNSIVPSSNFTIVAVSTGSNTFSISGKRGGLFIVGQTFTVSGSTGNDGDYTVTGVAYDTANDRTVITVASVVDATADGIIYTKKHTIYFPAVLGVANVSGVTSVVTTNTFYTDTHEFKVATTNVYDYTNNVSITDSTSQTTETKIVCPEGLCDVYCCISSMFNGYINNRCVNDKKAEDFAYKYKFATSHLSYLRSAYECGKSDKVNTIIAEILRITECEAGCGCSDGTPSLISGVGGGSGTSVVATSGNGILVSTNVVGSTTTYTLSLAQSIIDALNSIVSVTLVSSANINVNEVIDGSGNKTYTPTFTGTIPTVSEEATFKASIGYSGNLAVSTSPTINVADISYQNQSNLTTPTVADSTLADLNFPNTNNIFTVSGFQTVSNNTYKVNIDIVHLEATDQSTNVSYVGEAVPYSYYLEPYIIEKNSGSFKFRLGWAHITSPITTQWLFPYTNITINIKISE